MREVYITNECFAFIEASSVRVQRKFRYLLEILQEQEFIHGAFVAKLVHTEYYELRVRAENEIRVIIYTLDDQDFAKSLQVILLYAFIKKEKKDYRTAINIAEKLLIKYQSEE